MEGREGGGEWQGRWKKGKVEKKKREGVEEGNQERRIRGGKGARSEEKAEGGRRRGSRVSYRIFPWEGETLMCATLQQAHAHISAPQIHTLSISCSRWSGDTQSP